MLETISAPHIRLTISDIFILIPENFSFALNLRKDVIWLTLPYFEYASLGLHLQSHFT